MADIDRWVIRSALQLLSQRRRAGEKAAFFLSLSPEMLADDGLLIWICDALREFEIRGSWVTFQMQDQQALAQSARWSDLAAGLREVRCRTCINQYGLVDAVVGESRAAPDFVKFAPSLATGLAADRDKQQRLLELIRLVRKRGISSIITGIEDSRALNLLWDAGIEYVQGDYVQEATTQFDVTAGATGQNTGAGTSSEPHSLRL
jgi:EAL domain-containing protein (putative c-di-GMP-specific phosphodiesterase class I)